mgnify:FL=1
MTEAIRALDINYQQLQPALSSSWGGFELSCMAVVAVGCMSMIGLSCVLVLAKYGSLTFSL